MLHKIGYEVVYRDGAFKTPSYPSATTRHWSPLPDLILDALELGRDAVLTTSEAKWIVVIMRCVQHGFRTDNIMAKLVVYVPADADQGTELLEALANFEKVIGEHLGVPVDTAFRIIEEDGPKCEICGKKPEWVRRTQFSGNHFFCAVHAEAEEDFGDSSSNNMFWKHLEPATP